MTFVKPLAAIVAAVLTTALAGCETTAEKSSELAGKAGKLVSDQHGVNVGRSNPDVKILSRVTLSDDYGAAAFVEFRNSSKKPLVSAPVSIDVSDRSGKSLFRNDAPGLEPSLTTIAAVQPRATGFWVYDQLPAGSNPHGVAVRVGKSSAAPAALPRIALKNTRFFQDVDGPSLKGVAVNKSGVDQRKLVIYAVARQGRRVVAAGRGQIQRLAAHKSGKFQLFLIGKPKGAAYSFFAPPTVVR